MNSETDYTLCNLDSHHGYPNGSTGSYAPGTVDIYGGFHHHHHHHHTSINGGRSPLDPGQPSYYGSGDTSLSPQLGTPGELPPLSSGGTHHHHHHSHHRGGMAGYASGTASNIHTARGNDNSRGGYPHNIPAAHNNHHHHQHNSHQQQHHHHHHQQQIHCSSSSSSSSTSSTSDGMSGASIGHSNSNLHYTGTQIPHDLAMTAAAAELYHPSSSPHHSHHQHHQHHASLSNTPNFLDIGAAGSHVGIRTPPGYHHTNSGLTSGTGGAVVDQKYGLQAQLNAHSVVSGALTNGYLPPPPPTSSPLKSESSNSQPGLQGKPFRWMTIKRTPAKPGRLLLSSSYSLHIAIQCPIFTIPLL
ncbi:hypothetical protein PoB_004683500 [Plakobranchus ocellatus]|uniref:Uncharacterized protein n=1 Tax=Plakobranchus ocellatus TaxID=259542 RepID=A0AAV4BLL4_9GAST|nr:hypothetical protein PoB_004683500 [Plakobranchus ocellatus]